MSRDAALAILASTSPGLAAAIGSGAALDALSDRDSIDDPEGAARAIFAAVALRIMSPAAPRLAALLALGALAVAAPEHTEHGERARVEAETAVVDLVLAQLELLPADPPRGPVVELHAEDTFRGTPLHVVDVRIEPDGTMTALGDSRPVDPEIPMRPDPSRADAWISEGPVEAVTGVTLNGDGTFTVRGRAGADR